MALQIRSFEQLEYADAWSAMQRFTRERDAVQDDEFWFLEHAPVYTLGQAAKPEHLLNTGNIAVVQADRGGQVTYHGPGQLVVYLLLDLRRHNLSVRDLVDRIERSLIQLLAELGIEAMTRDGAPGVYVASGAKIASLGLRVKRGCSYHGLALNIDPDLAPFAGINPCGYAGLTMTSMARELGHPVLRDAVETRLLACLCEQLGIASWIAAEPCLPASALSRE